MEPWNLSSLKTIKQQSWTLTSPSFSSSFLTRSSAQSVTNIFFGYDSWHFHFEPYTSSISSLLGSLLFWCGFDVYFGIVAVMFDVLGLLLLLFAYLRFFLFVQLFRCSLSITYFCFPKLWIMISGFCDLALCSSSGHFHSGQWFLTILILFYMLWILVRVGIIHVRAVLVLLFFYLQIWPLTPSPSPS